MQKVFNWLTYKTLLIVSLVGIGLAFGIESLHRHGLLSRFVYKIIAEPLFHISVALFVVVIVLALLSREVFESWLRFAIFWVPLQLFIVISMAISDYGNSGGFFNAPMSEPISIFLSGVFLFLSLAIIVTKYITSR